MKHRFYGSSNSIKELPVEKPIAFSEFVSLIAMLMALVAFAINMILPAFRDMTKDLAIENENSIQLAVSLLYLGLALGQVIYGPLSDAIGRKPSIYLGLSLFMVGCMISMAANSLAVLIAGQVIQGIGLGAPRIVTLAIVRDKFEGNSMGRVMSFIMLVFILVPTISPALGQGILLVVNWRYIFITFLVLNGIMLIWLKMRLPETLMKNARIAFSTSRLRRHFMEVVKNRKAVGYTITLGLLSSAFIGYLNLSQQVFQEQYKLAELYPLYFAILSLSLGGALLTNGKLVMRFGMELMSKWALWSSSIASLAFSVVVIIYSGHPPFWALMIFMMLVLFCFGILVGNLNAMAMRPLGHIAGIGAAIIGSLSTAISVPFAILIGSSYAGSVLPMVAGFAIFGSMAVAVYYWTTKDKKVEDQIISPANSPFSAK